MHFFFRIRWFFFYECDCKKKVKSFPRTVDYFISSSPIKSFVKLMDLLNLIVLTVHCGTICIISFPDKSTNRAACLFTQLMLNSLSRLLPCSGEGWCVSLWDVGSLLHVWTELRFFREKLLFWGEFCNFTVKGCMCKYPPTPNTWWEHEIVLNTRSECWYRCSVNLPQWRRPFD